MNHDHNHSYFRFEYNCWSKNKTKNATNERILSTQRERNRATATTTIPNTWDRTKWLSERNIKMSFTIHIMNIYVLWVCISVFFFISFVLPLLSFFVWTRKHFNEIFLRTKHTTIRAQIRTEYFYDVHEKRNMLSWSGKTSKYKTKNTQKIASKFGVNLEFSERFSLRTPSYAIAPYASVLFSSCHSCRCHCSLDVNVCTGWLL